VQFRTGDVVGSCRCRHADMPRMTARLTLSAATEDNSRSTMRECAPGSVVSPSLHIRNCLAKPECLILSMGDSLPMATNGNREHEKSGSKRSSPGAYCGWMGRWARSSIPTRDEEQFRGKPLASPVRQPQELHEVLV